MALLKIKAMRLAEGLNQAEAAKKLNMARTWYSLLENGRLTPTTPMKERMEEFFGETAEELLEPVKIKSSMGDRVCG